MRSLLTILFALVVLFITVDCIRHPGNTATFIKQKYLNTKPGPDASAFIDESDDVDYRTCAMNGIAAAKLYVYDTSNKLDPSLAFDPTNSTFINNQQDFTFQNETTGTSTFTNNSGVFSGFGLIVYVFNNFVYPAAGNVEDIHTAYQAEPYVVYVNGTRVIRAKVTITAFIGEQSCSTGSYTTCTAGGKNGVAVLFTNEVYFNKNCQKIQLVVSQETGNILDPSSSATYLSQPNEAAATAWLTNYYCTVLRNGIFNQFDYFFRTTPTTSPNAVCQ